MSVSRDHDTRMLTALVQLRGALQAASLPLEAPGVEEARTARREMIDQLEDYVIPRQMSAEAPLLVVVGGSTGAGKSTLVNSLVGRRVTAAGLLRPTTRSPVLVHHPDDAIWFGQDRVLPDLVRVQESTDDSDALQLVGSDAVPAGLALVDAPDVDSVEERNRVLAGQLLGAADLWLFVTSAARYSDQVPWEHLREAAGRGAAVAVVLDRTPADSVPTVAAHLARMLASRGLKDSPLFTVDEAPLSGDGLLPAAAVADIRGWLTSLAGDAEARAIVVRQTLDGTIRTLARRTHAVADAAADQQRLADELREAVTTAYDGAVERLRAESADGSVLRGEALVRWQELIGTGELLKGLDQRVGRLRDRVVNAVRGTPQQADRVTTAVEAGVAALVLDHAETAAARTAAAWSETETGRALLSGHDDLRRAEPRLRRRTEAAAHAWREEVLGLVRSEGADKRTSARFLAYGVQGLGVALMAVVLTRGADDADDPSGPAGSGALGRRLLDAVFGDRVVASMVERATASLERRLAGLVEEERGRFLGVLDGLAVRAEAADDLRAASRRVDDRRYEQAQAGAEAGF